tara:strand:+ start:542 stop:736 length:195 start_codon:yes stop_codon:yes gene_type:complete
MDKNIKGLIVIGSLALFTQVFSVLNSSRINLDNKNTCVRFIYKRNFEFGETKEQARANAYEYCK